MTEPISRKVVQHKEWDFGDGYTPKWHHAVILECGHALPLPFQIAHNAARDAVDIPCGRCAEERDATERRKSDVSKVWKVGGLIAALQVCEPDALVYLYDEDMNRYYGLSQVKIRDECKSVRLVTDFSVWLEEAESEEKDQESES